MSRASLHSLQVQRREQGWLLRARRDLGDMASDLPSVPHRGGTVGPPHRGAFSLLGR